jgi:hypothetical protein
VGKESLLGSRIPMHAEHRPKVSFLEDCNHTTCSAWLADWQFLLEWCKCGASEDGKGESCDANLEMLQDGDHEFCAVGFL